MRRKHPALERAWPLYGWGKSARQLTEYNAVSNRKDPTMRKFKNGDLLANLTPHALNLEGCDPLEGCKNPPRVAMVNGPSVPMYDAGIGFVQIFPKTVFGDIDPPLPPAQGGVWLVVPRMIADHAQAAGRDDLLCVHGLLRDDAGRVVGAQGVTYA